jgi:hypothetical protein
LLEKENSELHKDTSVTVKAINKALIATIRTGNREFLAVYFLFVIELMQFIKALNLYVCVFIKASHILTE